MSDLYKIDPVVVIGVPTLQKRPLSWQWHDAFSQIVFPLGASHARFRIENELVAEARNQIAVKALEINAEWVLFISDDVIVPPDVYNLLVRHKKKLVTGVYWEKKPTCRDPYLWRDAMKGPFTDWKYGEFFKVDWAGCDCLLINTDVFRAIEYPYFSHDWRWEETYDQPATLATEDVYFYTKARAAGFDLWCDSGCQCLHQERRHGNVFGLDQTMKQHVDYTAIFPKRKKKTLVADVGCGGWSPTGENVHITRFDLNPEVEPDVVCDVRAIPEKNETFDIVYASHVLEHFFFWEIRKIVNEWLRILKIGGEIIILVPNLEMAAHEILKAVNDETYDAGYAHGMIYGTREKNDAADGHWAMKAESSDSTQTHKTGFIKPKLRQLLESFACLKDVVVEAKGYDGEATLTATAKKVKSSKPEVLLPTWNKEIAKKDGGKKLSTKNLKNVAVPPPDDDNGKNQTLTNVLDSKNITPTKLLKKKSKSGVKKKVTEKTVYPGGSVGPYNVKVKS